MLVEFHFITGYDVHQYGISDPMEYQMTFGIMDKQLVFCLHLLFFRLCNVFGKSRFPVHLHYSGL